MLAVAALGWCRRGSGIDGANSMERAEVVRRESTGRRAVHR